MTAYLRYELSKIENVFRQKKKIIINQSKKFIIASKKFLMMYEKTDEKRLSCIKFDQIESILKHLHDEHKHYEHVIIMNRLKKEAY